MDRHQVTTDPRNGRTCTHMWRKSGFEIPEEKLGTLFIAEHRRALRKHARWIVNAMHNSYVEARNLHFDTCLRQNWGDSLGFEFWIPIPIPDHAAGRSQAGGCDQEWICLFNWRSAAAAPIRAQKLFPVLRRPARRARRGANPSSRTFVR